MKHKKQCLVILILSLVPFQANFSFGQKGFWMSEKRLVDKYKMANAKFLKGKELFLKGKNDKAEKELKQCLETMPEHADALFFLSQIDYKKGEFDQALTDIEKAKSNYEFISQFYTFIDQQRLDVLRDEKLKLDSELMVLQDQLNRARTDEERQRIQADITIARNKLSIYSHTGPSERERIRGFSFCSTVLISKVLMKNKKN